MKSEVKGRRDQDALDLLRDQDRRMERLLSRVGRPRPRRHHPDDEVVQAGLASGNRREAHPPARRPSGWRPQTDVVRGLRHAGQDRMADVLAKHVGEVRDAIDRLDEHSRGMSALDLRYSDDFDRRSVRPTPPVAERVPRRTASSAWIASPPPWARGAPDSTAPTTWRSTPRSIRPSVATGITGLPRSCAPFALRPPAGLSHRREHGVLRRRPGGAVRCRQVGIARHSADPRRPGRRPRRSDQSPA